MKVLVLYGGTEWKPLYDWLERQGGGLELRMRETKIDARTLDWEPELMISYGYRFLIPGELVDRFYGRIINLHISLLPWNRGAHPNVWSFLEDTPKGVTIHLIDHGIDTGDILYQREMKFVETDETLASSYSKLHTIIRELFIEHWDEIRRFEFQPRIQSPGGTIHYERDFQRVEPLLTEGWNMNVSDLKKHYLRLRS